MRLSLISLILCLGILIGQALFYYNGLPDIIASHFDAARWRDAWMSKNGFFAFEFAIIAILLLQFLGVPWLVGRLPIRWLNLPNRDFWFADERREGTLRTIRVYFEWFAVMMTVLFVAVNQLVFEANMNSRNLWSTGMWIILAVYLVAVCVWMIALVLRFRHPQR